MLLSVENLHVYYGAIHAVKDVSLHVQEGEIVTLIGANGAGKSTVLNTISGILKPRSGKIQFMDHSLAGVAPNKIVQTGLVQCPEGRRVFARMTVEENLEMGAYTRPNAKFDDNLAHVYELFPRLKERRTQVGGTLSGCAPAWIFMVIEALADGAVYYGLPRDIAYKLASQTVLGSGKMVRDTKTHPGKLKDDVCSPGGITIRGVKALEAGGLRIAMMNAMEAAFKKPD